MEIGLGFHLSHILAERAKTVAHALSNTNSY